jgi:ABC-2 type transport system permease protein
MWRRLMSLMRKEFIQIRRDRRTLAMMLLIPVLWLVVFGYAATFDVREIPTAVAVPPGFPAAAQLVSTLDSSAYFKVVGSGYSTRADLEKAIQEGRASIGVMPPWAGAQGLFLADGSDLFTAQTAARQLQVLAQQLQQQFGSLLGTAGASGQNPTSPASSQGASGQMTFETVFLYNQDLRSANFMIPGLVGVVMVFIATIMTAVGVVRERERGTLEQLMVTPLSPLELMVGKMAPYVLISFFDLVVVVLAGVYLFHVPFAGSPLLLFLLSFLFLFSCLGIGVLVSTVSQTQQQAMQMAVFTLLPQILLSGFIFPLSAIPWSVRWVAYLAPLTYFLPIARGTFLKDAGMAQLWPYALVLAGYAVVVVSLAALRFRRRML